MRLRIRELRLARGLSQTYVAKMVGVKPCTVVQWESGDKMPMVSRLPALANALGVSMGELFAEEDRTQMSPGA